MIFVQPYSTVAFFFFNARSATILYVSFANHLYETGKRGDRVVAFAACIFLSFQKYRRFWRRRRMDPVVPFTLCKMILLAKRLFWTNQKFLVKSWRLSPNGDEFPLYLFLVKSSTWPVWCQNNGPEKSSRVEDNADFETWPSTYFVSSWNQCKKTYKRRPLLLFF